MSKIDIHHLTKKQRKQMHGWLRAIIQLLYFLFLPSAIQLLLQASNIFSHSWCRRKNRSDLFCVGTDCPVSVYHCIRAFLLWICLCIRKFWGCSSLCLCVDLQKNQEKAGETAGNSDFKTLNGEIRCAGCDCTPLLQRCVQSDTGYSPWDVFSMLHAFNFKLGGYLLGIVLLVLIMVGMAFRKDFSADSCVRWVQYSHYCRCCRSSPLRENGNSVSKAAVPVQNNVRQTSVCRRPVRWMSAVTVSSARNVLTPVHG